MKRVLWVDDDLEIRDTTKMVLEKNARYLVTGASYGTAACMILGKDFPDLLILDFMLLGMNGVEGLPNS